MGQICCVWVSVGRRWYSENLGRCWGFSMETQKPQKKVILPRKLTYPLKNDGWKTIFLLKCSLFRGDVNFHGCICSFVLFLGNGTTSPKPRELLFICLASSYATDSKACFWDTSFFFQKKEAPTFPVWSPFWKKTLFWKQIHFWVVVSNIFFVHPYLGKISILTNIFQMGWNHHLDLEGCVTLEGLQHFCEIFHSWFQWELGDFHSHYRIHRKNTQKLKNWQQSYTCKIDAWESAELDRCDRCELRNVSGRLPNIALDTGRIPWVWYPFFGGHKKTFSKRSLSQWMVGFYGNAKYTIHGSYG